MKAYNILYFLLHLLFMLFDLVCFFDQINIKERKINTYFFIAKYTEWEICIFYIINVFIISNQGIYIFSQILLRVNCFCCTLTVSNGMDFF